VRQIVAGVKYLRGGAERVRDDGAGLHAERGDRLGPDDGEQYAAGGRP
jgi:hypothetical protein